METKTCRGCGETKPLTEFYLHRGRPAGRCKPCFRAKLAESQMRPPKITTPAGMKRCTLCKETKPETEFFANKNFHDGLDRGCKTCRKARWAEWWARNNPTKVSA